jgi:hypothetical protein
MNSWPFTEPPLVPFDVKIVDDVISDGGGGGVTVAGVVACGPVYLLMTDATRSFKL